MIAKIKRSLQECMVITAQLQCALKACNKGNFEEARRYLEMAEKESEALRREVMKGA